MDVGRLAQHRRDLGAGGVVGREPALQPVDVVLQIVQYRFDVDFAAGTAQDAALEFAVELILEPIALVIDARSSSALTSLSTETIGGRAGRARRRWPRSWKSRAGAVGPSHWFS